MKKVYCRFCGSKCFSFKLDKKNPKQSSCKRTGCFISRTAPTGGNVKAPEWCPKIKTY